MPETAPGPSDRATANARRLPVADALPLALSAARSGDPIARTLAAWQRRLEEGSARTAMAYKREAARFLAFLGRSYGPGLDSLLQAQPSDCTAYIHAIAGQSGASVVRWILRAECPDRNPNQAEVGAGENAAIVL